MEEISIKHYKIKSSLGSGSFGSVFFVKNKKDKKEYAAKVSKTPFKDKIEGETRRKYSNNFLRS